MPDHFRRRCGRSTEKDVQIGALVMRRDFRCFGSLLVGGFGARNGLDTQAAVSTDDGQLSEVELRLLVRESQNRRPRSSVHT